ncbi:MAG: hypothetical protein RIQ89_1492, partial [Bacteroidota bacterium]
IMQDIEARLGEMFTERIGKTGRQVIISADVEEVINIMGKPEEFADNADNAGAPSVDPVGNTGTFKKRLFRNPDEKAVGGVCGGIASYFGWDPVWVRIAFFALIFFGFLSLWVYIILWIVVPEAKTAAEKLQMKGEPVTVSSIEKNVKEELEGIKSRMDKGKTLDGTPFSRFFDTLGDILKSIFLVLGKVVAVFVVIIGFIVLGALMTNLIWLINEPGVIIHGSDLPAQFYNVLEPSQWIGVWITAFLVLGIPVIMLIYAAFKSLFNVKYKSTAINFTALSLWVIGIILGFYMAVNISKEWQSREQVTQLITPEAPADSTIRILINTGSNNNYDDDFFRFGWHESDVFYTKFQIEKSVNGKFEIEKRMSGSGASTSEAQKNAAAIQYDIIQNGNEFNLSRNYKIQPAMKYRAQKLKLVFKVPAGYKVYLGSNTDWMFYDLKNEQNIIDEDMTNRTWLMTSDGLLKCIDCDGSEDRLFSESRSTEVNINGTIDVSDKGVKINADNAKIKIDENGVKISADGKEIVKIDSGNVIIRK